ncbi:MAG: glycosyltransferase family 4 protein [Anaerolineae bacterium]|nr:glycosyltransferase family 4 protein [Anaerolineae bacterium]
MRSEDVPAEKIRLAYILQDFHIGGMETWIYRLASRLRDRYDLTFVATEVEEITPRFHALGEAIYVGHDWLRLVRLLRRKRIQVVQYGNVRLYADCALAAGVPVVVERTDGLRSGVALRSKRGLDAVVASTRSTIEPIARLIPRKKIHLIYNGIDLAELDTTPPDRLDFGPEHIVIGRVSRFGAGKNLGLLIDAVRALARRYPQVRLVLVGDNSRIPGAPDEMSLLRERARGLEEFIRFTGHVEQPEALIRGFDIGACVSRPNNEGIPNSLLESMAARQPVVATAVDDIPELVEDGVNGLLIADNDLAGLVAALERLIADPMLRARLGAAGRATIERSFNLDVQAERYDALFRGLLETPRAPSVIVLRRLRFSLELTARIALESSPGRAISRFAARARGKLARLLQS